MDETEQNNYGFSPSSSQSGGVVTMMSPAAHYRTKVGNSTYSTGTMYSPVASSYAMSPSFGVATGFPMSPSFEYGRASSGSIGMMVSGIQNDLRLGVLPYQPVYNTLAGMIPGLGVPNFLGGQTHLSLVEECLKKMNKSQKKEFVKKLCSNTAIWGPSDILGLRTFVCENRMREYYKLGSNEEDDDEDEDDDEEDKKIRAGALHYGNKTYGYIKLVVYVNNTETPGVSYYSPSGTDFPIYDTVKEDNNDNSELNRLRHAIIRIFRTKLSPLNEGGSIFAYGLPNVAETNNKKRVLLVCMIFDGDNANVARLNAKFNSNLKTDGQITGQMKEIIANQVVKQSPSMQRNSIGTFA